MNVEPKEQENAMSEEQQQPERNIPNLAGVATGNLVEKIGTGKFSASYINWSRTLNLLREHAPDWLPECVPAENGGLLHNAPNGGYLLIRFVRPDGSATPTTPQAVMDNRNQAIPLERITARDITDTHRRGVCLAAAMFFGLAYELWAKIPLESWLPHDEENGDKHASINDDQAAELRTLAEKLDDAGHERFMTWLTKSFEIDSVSDIPASQFGAIRAMLAKKTEPKE